MQTQLKSSFQKLDKYPFEIIQININYDGTLFIPISKINELRRNLFEKLENEAINSYKHKNKTVKLDEGESPQKDEDQTFHFTQTI